MTTEIDLTLIKDRLARTRHLPGFLTEGDIAIAKAHEDIAALVAEVERLRAQVNELACLWDAVTDAVGVDTDSTRGEWQTAFDAKIESYHGHGYESGKRDGREENKRLRAQIDAVKDSAHVSHGPVGVLPDDADAAYMRHAAMNIRKGHKVGGSNVSSAVANLLDTVAKILGGEE